MKSRVLHRSLRRSMEVAHTGSGAFLTTADGRNVLDASGGAAVSCVGHGHPRIVQAIQRQASTLAYAHTSFFTSGPAEELANTLVGQEPGGLSHAYFVSSGSEAVEACLKLARQYFVERGELNRVHFIARRQSYHGNTFGALSIGGHASRRGFYAPLLIPHVSHVSPCFSFRNKRPNETTAQYVERLTSELDAEFLRVGPENVVAFVAEPVVGATLGCVTAEPGYFAAVRKICDRYGALLILDEVMCGMGRCGTAHAWEHEGVAPDLQAIAKGLGAGYIPLGAMLVSGRVMKALEEGSGEFVHGHTFQAHPVACAAALEVQKLIHEERLIDNCRQLGAELNLRLRARFGEHPHVGDIRGRGLFQALEFVSSRASMSGFKPSDRFSVRLKNNALRAGLAIYPGGGTIDGVCGDHVLIAPPYNVTSEQLDTIVELLAGAVDATVSEVGRDHAS